MTSFIPSHRGVVTKRPGERNGPTRAVEYEFAWIVEGGGRWWYSGGEYTLDPRTVLLARPGMVAFDVYPSERITRNGFIQFRRTRVLDHLKLPNEDAWPVVRDLADGDPIRPLLRHVLRLRDNYPEERRSAGHILELAVELFVLGHQLEPQDDLPRGLRTAIQHVRSEWADGHLRAVPVAEMAAAAAISSEHLWRLFRTRFGLAPSAVLELIRLSHAAALLTKSDLTLNDAAKACGFADAYHLSHRFRPRYGMPPGQYRTDPAAPSPMAPLYATGLEHLAEKLL